MTILDAIARLKADGLHAARSGEHFILIAEAVRDVGDGLRLLDDACSLVADDGQWVAILPALGQLTYEVPGTPSELISLILSVYARHRRAGGPLHDAVKAVVTDPERYIVGRSAAPV